MLCTLAEVLEVSTATLLGETVEAEETRMADEIKILSEKLEIINLQLARQSERRRKLWRIIFIIAMVIAALALIADFGVELYIRYLMNNTSLGEAASVGIIGGADGPTTVFVTTTAVPGNILRSLLPLLAMLLAGVGIYKTKPHHD